MEKQFKRFLELSLRFTKTKREALGEFPKELYGSVNICQVVTSENSTYFIDNSKRVQVKSKSTADLIREEAEKKAVIADEYEEYLELQKNLGDFFQATDKLNK